jgi:hypothetical protein
LKNFEVLSAQLCGLVGQRDDVLVGQVSGFDSRGNAVFGA